MSIIQYPQDWVGPESIATVINYAELSKLAKANDLNGGHLNYLVRAMQDTVLGTIDRMIAEDHGYIKTDKGEEK